MAEAQQVLVQQLQRKGYTIPEANEIVRLAQQMVGVGRRRPRNPTLDSSNPLQRRIAEGDLRAARDALVSVARRSRERPRDIVMDSASLFRGPQTRIAISPGTRPAPVQTHVYRVTISDQTYQVQLRNPLPRSAGMASITTGRAAQLRQTLLRSSSDVMAVTLPNGTTARPGSPQFNQFVRTYSASFRDMVASGDPSRIEIEAVRQRRI